MAWYGFGLSSTGKIAPMLAGFINYGQNWRWSLWWTAIWVSIAFVYCFFLMEETNYDRNLASRTSTMAASSEASSPSESIIHVQTTKEKSQPEAPNPDAHSMDVEQGETIYHRKTYWEKLGVVDKKRPNRLLDIFLAPFKGFTYPAVVYAGLLYGADNLVWSGIQNATTGTVYPEVYGWSTLDIAAGYSAALIGAIIGGYTTGKGARVLTMKLARRNGGISEPEHTLW